LKSDINGAELVIGVIGPETADSLYVLFELGASWGRGVPTFPVLVRGASRQDIPGPLSERHSVSLDEEASCLQLMGDIAEETVALSHRRQYIEDRQSEPIELLSVLSGDFQSFDEILAEDRCRIGAKTTFLQAS